jgi:hypothetical protein
VISDDRRARRGGGTFAAGRADRLLDDGDVGGAAVWRRILAAIEELQRERREGEAIN